MENKIQIIRGKTRDMLLIPKDITQNEIDILNFIYNTNFKLIVHNKKRWIKKF